MSGSSGGDVLVLLQYRRPPARAVVTTGPLIKGVSLHRTGSPRLSRAPTKCVLGTVPLRPGSVATASWERCHCVLGAVSLRPGSVATASWEQCHCVLGAVSLRPGSVVTACFAIQDRLIRHTFMPLFKGDLSNGSQTELEVLKKQKGRFDPDQM